MTLLRMTSSPPEHGTITAWSLLDNVGRITLDSGEVLRFGGSGCVGFTPAQEHSVYVVAAEPHPLGGRRAKLVNLTGAPTEDPVAAGLRRAEHAHREAAEWRRKQAALQMVLQALPGPVEAAKELGLTNALELTLLEKARSHEAAVRRGVKKLDLGFVDFEWCFDTWSEEPRDPCLFTIGGADGDDLGIYVHPATTGAQGPFPVVYYFHEQDPAYRVVAPSLRAFLGMTAPKEFPKSPVVEVPAAVVAAIGALNGPSSTDSVSEERRLCREFMWTPGDAGVGPAKHLLAHLRILGWDLQSKSLEFKLNAMGFLEV